MGDSKVLDLKPFVPAKDYESSKRFYADLGFRQNWANAEVAEFEIDGFRFLLQNFYVEALAANFMMSLTVASADLWWQRIEALDLKTKYRLQTAKPPAVQPWGLRVLYLSDPAGVLWHIVDQSARP